MTPRPIEGDVEGWDQPAEDEGAARRRHPSTHPWRTDRDGLAARLAAHLEASGWPASAARTAAEGARAAAGDR